MKILIDVGHPAHVHYFKNFMWEMRKRGHEFMITARDRNYVFDLLNKYGFDYVSRGRGSSTLLGKILYIPEADFTIYKAAGKFRPDLFMSFGSPYAAHVSKLLGRLHLAFDDTEHAKLEHMLYVPFTDYICTPKSFRKDFGEKHLRFDGFMQLCYLHPLYFKPDPEVLSELNLSRGDRFSIIRFVSWGASHDTGQRGFSLEEKRLLVSELNRFGRVFISSEGILPREFNKYRLSLSPEKMHSLLHYASLYIGEGGTMSSEAAVLGTPSIHVSTTAKNCGVFYELRDKYNLMYFYDLAGDGIKKASEIMGDPGSKQAWVSRRDKMLSEKTDVTAFMVDLTSNFPESINKYSSR